MAIASFDFKFQGFVGQGNCYLTIDSGQKKSRPSVVCSQKRNYTGTSITNALEDIARKLYVEVAQDRIKTTGRGQRDVLDALRSFWSERKPTGLRTLYGTSGVRWIEHYPPGTGLALGDSFREVVFDAEDSPLWMSTFNAKLAEVEFGAELIQQAMRSKSLKRAT